MKRHALSFLSAAVALAQAGCVDVNLRDAVAAGVFDFVSGTVTAILASLIPLPGP